ncbi:GNAT family N-acetyltransferase [Krasilnikovia sp. MM14-A1004]|uniref:GNAT family N-acetyltransferase n=1 Tax=Krasilnikovia sp. MM14-A1004 TaxID=3373541 RepID=UPI00399C4C6E
MYDLAEVVARIERAERLPADPWLDVVPAPAPHTAAVASFPGHVVVAADVDRPFVESFTDGNDLAAPLGPQFLGALEERLRLAAGSTDVVLLAASGEGDPLPDLKPVPDSTHPRAVRARLHRSDVQVWSCGPGIVVVGRGVAGRWEVSIEVDEDARNAGLGRALASAARRLVPDGRPVWAQVASGNVASLRAFLAAGYAPIGAEVLLTPVVSTVA